MERKSTKDRTFISFDWAMKRLLKRKDSHVILEGFLSELFRQNIKITEILDPESLAEHANDRTNRVDLLCKSSLDEHIIVELQYHYEMDYFQRILFGASKLVTQYMLQGAPYRSIKKVFSVHILYFNLGDGHDYVYYGQTQFTGMHLHDRLKLSLIQQKEFNRVFAGEIFPEYYLIKIPNFDKSLSDTLDEWIYYLKTSELPEVYHAQGLDEVEKQLNLDQMDPETKSKYMEMLQGLNVSEDVLTSYWKEGLAEGEQRGFERGIEEGIEKGKSVGFEEGIEKGIEKGKSVGFEEGERRAFESTVVRMFKSGLDIDRIAQIQEISRAEVESILSKN
jgi:predicted transposase/invertase (TIGR01784 family)